jgi:NADH-quinone oxidoreductase subunit M
MVMSKEVREVYEKISALLASLCDKYFIYIVYVTTILSCLFFHWILDFIGFDWLQILVLYPVYAIVVVIWLAVSKRSEKVLKVVSLIMSLYILIEVMVLWLNLLVVVGYPQYLSVVKLYVGAGFSIDYALGVDGITIWFIILSALLIPICLLLNWKSITFRVMESIVLYFLVETLLFNVFFVLDIFLFYLFFEALLIPMFLIIGIWGSRGRRIHASYQFFLYTLLGSVSMLLGILYLYYTCGTTNWYVVAVAPLSDIEILFVLGAFYLAFIVKVPLYPVHIWLPEAHVEAPTGGSVLLAGIMLKLGTYGILKYCIFLWPTHNQYYIPFLLVITTFGIIFGSLATIRQIDLKKSIAYSSVAHMSYVIQGLLMSSGTGLEGAFLLMLGHGFVSSALFICVGIIYDRYHTRIITYYGNLIVVMPVFGLLFYLFTLGNMNFPGTVNFISELLVSIGLGYLNAGILFLSVSSMILSGIYAMWLYNRVVFGPANIKASLFCDITRREFFILLPLLAFMLLLGVFPEIVLNSVRVTLVYYGM